MNFLKKLLITISMLLPVCFIHTGICAQELLGKNISVDVKKKPLRDVLAMIGKQGGFYFSYNSNIIPNDSLVTITAKNKPIKSILETLLGEKCQYKETDNHIIIQPAEREKWFTISGYLIDERTGQKVSEASVFEEQQLVSTLSDTQGYFKLRLKDREKYAAARIRVSKGFYRDTVITTGQGYDQQILIPFSPADYTLPGVIITQSSAEDDSWFKDFIPESLIKQTRNLTKFFVNKPYQFSLLPGFGTHGKLSGQVTNHFSFNLAGGYCAGVKGFEMGGLFNIDRKDMHGVQIGGLSNNVGGNVRGVQVSGVINKVTGNVRGVQVSGIITRVKKNDEGLSISGISSHVGGNMNGLQISGIANFVRNLDSSGERIDNSHDSMSGMQLAGILNTVAANVEGFQLAGIENICFGEMHGMQLSGILNRARKVKGFQLGLINICDSVEGFSLGLINIAKKGYHKLALSTNELTNLNAAYKAGNKHIYSIMAFGYNTKANKKAYSLGYGIGNEISLSRRLAVSTQVTANYLYQGDDNSAPFLLKLQPSVDVVILKRLYLFGGPSLSYCPTMQSIAVAGYAVGVPEQAFKKYETGNANKGLWLGWQVGVQLF